MPKAERSRSRRHRVSGAHVKGFGDGRASKGVTDTSAPPRFPSSSPWPNEAMLFFSASRSHVKRATLPRSSSYFRSLTKCFTEKAKRAR